MATRGTCELCHASVTSYETAAYPIAGWEVERAQGGANRILGRQRVPNRIAHAPCIERQLRDGGQQQMDLTPVG